MPSTLLIFSQVFIPDPTSAGRHMADVAFEMARRGYRVIVYASRRGSDDSSAIYPRREVIDGVEIRRLPFASSGSRSFWVRRLGAVSFMLQAMLRAGMTMNLAGVLFGTSPQFVGFAATIVKMFRTVPIAYWAMQLSPDHLIALGRIQHDGMKAQVLGNANRTILRNSSLIVALDRFMADRLRTRTRLHLDEKMVIIPPWAHDVIEPVPHEQNPFRKFHGLEGKFVIMYSGNHSPNNPLQTLLDAALRLRDRDDIRFVFVGGGIGKAEVVAFQEAHALGNMAVLPYQPMTELRHSLASADVSVVSLGDRMAGIVHPSEVYGAMAAGRPILYFGPSPSHVSDLLNHYPIGERVSHGDVDGAVRAILRLKEIGRERLDGMGDAARKVISDHFSQTLLCGQFCDGLEAILR